MIGKFNSIENEEREYFQSECDYEAAWDEESRVWEEEENYSEEEAVGVG